ncbi:MAG: response regulator [Kiloniellales bacterium]
MNSQSRIVPIEILLVEDSPGDVRLTREALKEAKVRNNLAVVPDGDAAMRYLLREGEFVDAPKVDLIILDLNLPGKDGREVLKEVKQHQTLRRIPVVVLTTSADEYDVLRSYELYANCYITKPVTMNSFIDVVQSIDSFWFSIVKLPSA